MRKNLHYLLLLLSIFLLYGCQSFPHVETEWLSDGSLPEVMGTLKSYDHPNTASADEVGIEHHLLSCEQQGEAIIYHLNFTNPYPQPLSIVTAASIDTRTEGTVWGFHKIVLNPGNNATIIDSSNAPAESADRVKRDIFGKTFSSDMRCAVQYIGVLEDAQFKINAPTIGMIPLDQQREVLEIDSVIQ